MARETCPRILMITSSSAPDSLVSAKPAETTTTLTRAAGGNLAPPYQLVAPSRRWRPCARTRANSCRPTAGSMSDHATAMMRRPFPPRPSRGFQRVQVLGDAGPPSRRLLPFVPGYPRRSPSIQERLTGWRAHGACRITWSPRCRPRLRFGHESLDLALAPELLCADSNGRLTPAPSLQAELRRGEILQCSVGHLPGWGVTGAGRPYAAYLCTASKSP